MSDDRIAVLVSEGEDGEDCILDDCCHRGKVHKHFVIDISGLDADVVLNVVTHVTDRLKQIAANSQEHLLVTDREEIKLARMKPASDKPV